MLLISEGKNVNMHATFIRKSTKKNHSISDSKKARRKMMEIAITNFFTFDFKNEMKSCKEKFEHEKPQ